MVNENLNVTVAEEVMVPVRFRLLCTKCSRQMALTGKRKMGPRGELWNEYTCAGCGQQCVDKRQFPSMEFRPASEGTSEADYSGGGMG